MESAPRPRVESAPSMSRREKATQILYTIRQKAQAVEENIRKTAEGKSTTVRSFAESALQKVSGIGKKTDQIIGDHPGLAETEETSKEEVKRPNEAQIPLPHLQNETVASEAINNSATEGKQDQDEVSNNTMEGIDTQESSLDDVFSLFTDEHVEFSSSGSERRKFATITLATHGQRITHLLGGGQTRGILQQVEDNGMEQGLKLRAKEENNFLEVPVEALSNFGGGQAFEAGEPRVSFQLNDIASYGEVNWVLPASKVIRNGGGVEVTFDPTQPRGQQDGLHSMNRELGYYSPLGLSLAAGQRGERADTILSTVDSLLSSETSSAPDIFRNIVAEYGQFSDRNARETSEEYSMRKLGKSIDALTKDDVLAFIHGEREVHRDTMAKASEAASAHRHQDGVALMDPMAICFVTEQDAVRIKDQINEMSNLTDQQRLFLSQQIVSYETTEEDMDGMIGLSQRIKDLSQNPRTYAALILPNMRLTLNKPDMDVSEVEAMLLEQESLVDSSRFAKLGSTGLFATSPQSLT
jgi:hypothetical protein